MVADYMETFAKVLVVLGGMALVYWMARGHQKSQIQKTTKTKPRKETAKDLVYEALGERKVLDEMGCPAIRRPEYEAYIAVTDKAVLVGRHYHGENKVKTYPLDQISLVDVQQRWRDTDLEIGTTGGVEFAQDTTPFKSRVRNENILTWSNSEYSRVQQLAQAILDARAAFIHGQKPSVQPVAESIPDQIEKLAELHKQGILSDEEFSGKKAELLKRM